MSGSRFKTYTLNIAQIIMLIVGFFVALVSASAWFGYYENYYFFGFTPIGGFLLGVIMLVISFYVIPAMIHANMGDAGTVFGIVLIVMYIVASFYFGGGFLTCKGEVQNPDDTYYRMKLNVTDWGTYPNTSDAEPITIKTYDSDTMESLGTVDVWNSTYGYTKVSNIAWKKDKILKVNVTDAQNLIVSDTYRTLTVPLDATFILDYDVHLDISWIQYA